MGGERDTRVIYKTRVLDKDETRSPIPTALDPYDSPYAAGPLRSGRNGARDSNSSIGESSSVTERARSGPRSIYSGRDDPRRSIVAATESRGSCDRGRDREYYRDDRPRQGISPYVIEAKGEVIDVFVPGGSRDRGFGKDPRLYNCSDNRSPRGSPYRGDHSRAQYVRPIQSGNRDQGPGLVRVQHEEYRSPRSSGREVDYEREEDWRLVDSMRDTRIGTARPSEANVEPSPRRSRAQTYSSEDSYVMVSPTIPPGSTPETSRSRSAIARKDYPEHERSRRRSRSISFRGSQVDFHDASERKHERPGAEANLCGPYLRRRPRDWDDDGNSIYTNASVDRRSRGRDQGSSAGPYRERDGPYPPQLDHVPRGERSGRRRRDDESDDRSYYSENVTKKVTTETRYR